MTNKQEALKEKLEKLGFSVKNIEDYKNADSIITITCKNNHTQTSSINNFAKKDWECINCIALEESQLKSKEGYLLSLDAATNTTGWAVLNKEGQLLQSGFFCADKKLPLMGRINQLLDEINRLIKLFNIRVIAIEAIQLEWNTKVYETLAMLRGILFYNLEYLQGYKIYSFGADVWRSYSHIIGANRQEKKENTMERAKIIYNRDFEEDEADAIFLGKYVYAQIRKSDLEGE